MTLLYECAYHVNQKERGSGTCSEKSGSKKKKVGQVKVDSADTNLATSQFG